MLGSEEILKSKSVSTKKDKIDQFDKDLIKTTVHNLFRKNECVTLKKLKQLLEKNHEISLSKYKLWKTLHELGFRYKRVDKNRKGLVERKDIVNQRIQYLRTIKKKREEGYTVVYLDETWVDTNHTTSHQWTSSEDTKNRKIPLDSEIESESENDDLSDGDETEDYEWP
ncbi:unnamed protein product [Mytilus edulis]|uniref:Winged helix-turn helix domain-containing protein n=1 Tax=Mytilus edulis TaxID=6550 RepID=A0A8S3VLU0_MYTED|nr:unnamed protein product [Mytilus edulis]